MKLHTIDTGFFKLDGGAMFGVVPKTIWQRLNPPDAKNLCTWAMRCLLIENEGRLILVDTGIGDKQDDKFFSYFEPHGEDTLEKSLQKKGFTSDDITDVILTHLHFDHVGGAVKRNKNGTLVPTFKNAIYWSNEAHWKTATAPNYREKASFLKENILPIQESGQLQFTKENAELYPNIQLKYVHGHTEAMMLPHIQYKGRKLVYMADLIPSTAHIRLPYIMAYDMQPLKTLDEKECYLKYGSGENWVYFFEHDKEVECATVQHTDRGFKIKETFKLEEL